MDFELTADQVARVDRAEIFAITELAPGALRREEWKASDFWAHNRHLAERGYLGLGLPRQFGGQGLPLLDVGLMIETVAKDCPVSAGMIRNASYGPISFIRQLGTGEQQNHLIPRVVRGEAVVAVCITEPDAGTAATDLQTSAAPDSHGDCEITGVKCLITDADLAEALVVAARFPGGGIGAVLVDQNASGVRLIEKSPHMGGGAVWKLSFTKCRGEVLLDGDRVPRAFSRLMAVYDEERLAGLFRLLGIAQGALLRSLNWSTTRHQFGHAIGEFEAIQHKLADMAVRLESARLLVYRAACHPSPLTISLAKVAAAEAAVWVTDQAIQIHGGYGYLREYGLEWRYRLARQALITGGTVEIHRNMIARRMMRQETESSEGRTREV